MERFSELFQTVRTFLRCRVVHFTGYANHYLGKVALKLTVLLLLTVSTTAIAFAVHNNGFELDSDAVDNPSDPHNANDWANIANGSHNAHATTGIVSDGDNPPKDVTYFTGGGSKDVNDIDQWRHTNNDQAPDKDELTNIYAATYQDGDTVALYFGADRYASNGNSQIGFWFFQQEVTANPDGTFDGQHSIGDLLILSDFVKGGKIPDVKVYEWVGYGNADGPLKEVMSGADCDDIPADGDFRVCATINDEPVAAPWDYTPKNGDPNTFPIGSFYEGGLNLTNTGLSNDTCYASFLVETRSSSSLDATLKDFSLKSLDICTTPQGEASLSITPKISAARARINDTINDSLTFTISATQSPDGVNAEPAGGVVVSALLRDEFGAAASGDTSCITDNNEGPTKGTCTITLSSATTGKTTLDVSADIEVNGTTLSREDSATMNWVDAQLTLTPTGNNVNPVGQPITVTAQLNFDYGDGRNFVSAPANNIITIPITISSSTTSTTITQTCTTDLNGACSIYYPGDTPGIVNISGVWQGDIDIVNGVDASASDQVTPDRRWVGGQLLLLPGLTANQIGSTRQLTAQLRYDDGLSLTALPGQTIFFEINGPGVPSDGSCTTQASGDCTFSFSSTVTGTSVVSAAWNGEFFIEGTTTPVPGSASDAAETVWADVRLSLEPATAAALAGTDQPQTVTAKIEVDSGSGFVTPLSASGPVSVTISSGPGTPGNTPCELGGGSSCQITLNSDAPGLTQLSATWNGEVEVQGLMTPASAGPASAGYRWVTAALSLNPESAGSITGRPHTLTATLQFDTGSGPQPAVLEKTQEITFTVDGVGSLAAPNCLEAGNCQVTLTSSEVGTSTITATWSGTIDTGEGNVPVTLSDVATKNWFNLRVTIGEPFGSEAECTDLDPEGFNPNDSVTDLLLNPNASITPANLRPLNQLVPGSTQSSRLCNDQDFDFYWLDIKESSFITITLSGMETDYDVAVYALPENFDLNGPDSVEDALTLIHLQNYADIDSAGRMSSGRMSSGRMSSGRMSSGRMSSGRMSSGRMSSGRMSSGSDLSGAVDEQTVTYIAGPQRVFVAVFSGVGAYGPQYDLNVQTTSGDKGNNTCTSTLPDYRAPGSSLPGYSTAPMGSGNPKTLILTHLGRLEALYDTTVTTATDKLLERLQTFAARPEINGLIVPVESNPAVKAAYEAWNLNYCSIGAANNVADAIKANIISQYPDIEYIVIAGSHEVIPFRQVPDYVSISPESDYLESSLIVPNNPLYWTLANSWISTDDFYADAEPNLFRGRELYVPDLPIGRLVEKPAEMITVITNYEASNGLADINTCMVTGYEFLSDSAAAIETQLRRFDLAPDTLTDDFWTRANLNNIWSTGPDLVSVNAHFEHYRLLPAIAGNQNQLFTSGDLPNNIGNSVNYSLGCHSGFNVPDDFVTLAQAQLDFPQAFARKGAAAWVANTGYGYGDDEAIADSELLMLFLTQELGAPVTGGVTTGDALVAAKQRFVGNFSADAFGLFEEKSLIEATLYGLPMHRVGVPTQQAVASVTNSLYPLAKLPGLASLDTNTTLVSRQAPQQVSAGLTSQLHSISNFMLTEHVTPRGRFYSAGGLDQVQVIPNQPIQPKKIEPLDPINGQLARGALLISAVFNDMPNFDPVVSIPMSDTTILEPAFSVNGWFPDQPWEINRLGDAPRLMLVPGQYNTINRTERKYSAMDIEVYHSGNTNDFHPAGIWAVNSACSSGSPVAFSIKADDAAGLARVLITYQQGGGWQSADLPTITPHPDADGSFLASGDIALPANTPYFVQVLDNAGNVSVETNKGHYFQTCVDRPDATNNLESDSSTHAITVRLEKDQGNGWQPVSDGSYFAPGFVTVEGGQIANNTCGLVIGTDGTCEIRISSETEGFTTVSVAPVVTVTVNNETYPLQTGFEGENSWRGRYVKEWWSGSISLFKQVTAGSTEVCFTLGRHGDSSFGQQRQCVPVSGAHTFEWTGLPVGSNYVITETVSGGYVAMQPNPLTDIEVNDANRHVVLRTEINSTGRGCTPGYWKTHLERWSLTPQANFKDVFGLSSFPKNPTLEQAINLGGGATEKLARHGVAALLNSRTNAVNFPYSQEQVIKMVQAGMNSKGEPQASYLATANELGCPLN